MSESLVDAEQQLDRVAGTDRWWRKAVVYQVYPRSFYDSNGDGIGDLRGVIAKIPYLQRLGVDVIWLNPIFASPNVDNGYDTSDYFEIQPEFGTVADFQELVDTAHAAGLKIVLDLVVNHTSDQHKWFQHSRSSNPGKYRDYYIWRAAVGTGTGPGGGTPPNNWKSSFGGSTWQWDNTVGEYYLHLFAAAQPDLNWENSQVRAEVYNIMQHWLQFGVDGFRMDVINLISKRQDFASTTPEADGYGSYYPGCAGGPRIHEYLREIRALGTKGFDPVLIGETPRTTAAQAQLYTDPTRGELDMVFHFEHMHIDRDGPDKWSIKQAELSDLRRVLSHWQETLADAGWNSLYWSNHDQPRTVSRFGNDTRYRVESAKMLGTLLHMMCGTPFIYQGEELGMTNCEFATPEEYEDIDSRNAYRNLTASGLSHSQAMERIHLRSRDNARTPVQWTNGRNAGFTEGTPWMPVNANYTQINADAALADPDSVYYHYQRLIELRHNLDIITTGRYRTILDNDPQIYAYVRETADQTLLVACNFTASPALFKAPADLSLGDAKLLLSNYPEQSSLDEFELHPYEAVIYLLSNNPKQSH